MGRACFPAVVAVCAGLAAGAIAADAGAKQARLLLPPGGIWQSIPYEKDAGEPSESTVERVAPSAPAAGFVKPRAAAKPENTLPKASAKAHPPRHPVAAAAVSEDAPRGSAAARAKELERRLDVLLPGTRLGTPLADHENPAWRRARPGRPAGENNSVSVPFDDKGQAGFIARGYHAQPDVQNPHGNTGATFGVRTRF